MILKSTTMNKLTLALILLIYAVPGFSQNQLEDMFKQLVNKEWEGHYVNSEDSVYTHQLRFEYTLAKKVVKEMKDVPELDFHMETYYYFDWKNDNISFLTLLNKDMVSSGKVVMGGQKIMQIGTNYYDGGSQEFKKTYEINDEEELIDLFYRKKGDMWIRGHVIRYQN